MKSAGRATTLCDLTPERPRSSRHRWIYAATVPALAVAFLAPLRYGAALLVLACVAWWWTEASA